MSAFPNWQKYAVHQKRRGTGCIPTAYEILLRAAEVSDVDFETFQDDFDLDKNGGTPRNHFDSVAKVIEDKYPQIKFHCEPFPKGSGNKKLARVEDFIQKKQPVIVSLANAPYGGKGWHIMVVVDATTDELTLLEYVDSQGKIKTKTVSKEKFVSIHDNYPGGDEIAYLLTPNNNKPKGDCYKAAFEALLELFKLEESGAAKEKGWKLTPLVLVHGSAVAPVGPYAGKEIKHAWVETGGNILEVSNGNQERYSAEQWEKHYKGIARKKYTKEEAELFVKETRHFGPWD